jgi:hypothetical protein
MIKPLSQTQKLTTMRSRSTFLVVPCLVASPSSLAFKSTCSFNSGSAGGTPSPGGGYRRPPQDGRSRSHISIRQQQSSGAVLLVLAGADDVDPSSNSSFSSSSSVAATIEISDSVEQRRFSAAATEKAEILLFSGGDDDDASATATSIVGAATGSVNERLLSEIQASLDKEKYGPPKTREYFKEFRSQKSEEERRRSIEEARDLNGVNPLVCIGGAGFAWSCAGALWALTTYLGYLFASHPVDVDSVYFVQRLASVFRNVVVGLASLASGFFGVVGVGIFLLGVRVAYGVMTGELDPTPIKRPKSEEIVLPDVWGLMTGKRPNRRGKRGGGGEDNPYGL